ncbi:MAG: DMT family transporter [Muribaculaceae bacterium]|nr:DMT family transporter [Muribaculaceae bacterium]
MTPRLKGNLEMFASKVFSGLNQNALRYLLPTWMGAITGVVFRLGFGSIFFWIWGFFTRNKFPKPTLRDVITLFFVGVIFVFGYMWCLLEGLSYTTPISSSIFISLQPVWVYIICLCLRTDQISWGKVIGMLIGFGGALLCVLTQHSSDIASDPLKGNMLCLGGSVLFAGYLVIEKRYLHRLGSAMVSKWTFLGGAIAAAVLVCFTGWDAPVLHQNFFSTPMLVLLFVLIFPSSVSYLLQDFALTKLPATVVALYGDLILIVSAIASYILGQDRFSWWQIAAILLMLGSVYLVEVAESKSDSTQTSR